MNQYVQNRVSFHTLTYWNAFGQLVFYTLAVLWLARNLSHRGFWHTASIAVKSSAN